MPRAKSKTHLGTQSYHSQFTNVHQCLPDAASPPVSPVSTQPAPAAASAPPCPKKQHVCQVCNRPFTTSGHLARHSRVHTGERNHKCPFPGCETRCARQDNLQQHYRIHLSPCSRRSSTRSAAVRNAKRGSTASSTTPSAAPSLSSPPPALEPSHQQHIHSHHSTPPDSPPPLAQATLPATACLPTISSRSSPSALPETQYGSPNHNLVPITSQALSMNGGNSQNYPQYRSGNSYPDNGGFTYIHSPSTQSSNSYPSYSNTQHDTYNGKQQQQPQQHLQQQQQHHHQQHHQYQTQIHVQQRDNSPNSVSSRHSISHISHPQTNYHPQASSSTSPASSHSVSSHTSGPPTLTYPVFHDDAAHTYHHNGAMLAEQHHPGIDGAAHLMHGGYNTGGNGGHGGHAHGRFDSPPPVLAPTQDERLLRARDERQVYTHSHHTSPYIQHPQSLATDYPYHQSLGLSHGAWKGDGGMRKNVATALV